MSARENDVLVREAVGVFETAETFEAAVDELLNSGFNRSALSLLAGETAVREKLHHMYKNVGELDDNAAVPRAAYVSTESIGDAEGGLIGGLMYVGAMAAAGSIVASGGALAAAIAGAGMAGAAGGLIGAGLAGWVGQHHADYLQGQIERGGLLLWVRTQDEAHEKRATQIMSKHSAHNVHVHGIPTTDG